MPALAAGRMDRQIVIQTATTTRDPITNQDVLDWDTGQSVAAEWLPSSAREVWQARQINAEVEGIYQVYDRTPRPTPNLTRIVGHDGLTYDVTGVTEIRRGAGWQLAVVAKSSA